MSQAIATNKKAFRDYVLSEFWECGIELQGGEVKSVRAGKVNFKDAFARVDNGEVFLYNLHIDPYKQAGYLNPAADRPRRLLVHKREIRKIAEAVNIKKMVLVPTKIYFNKRGYVKIELGVGKGKKLYDKREDIKKRDIQRQIGRLMRGRR